MSTTVVFTPTSTTVFSFNATLDGAVYTCSIAWNIWAQRWYLNIFDQTNTLILARALIASPSDYPINLLFGYFTTTMYFDDASQSFLIST